VTIIVNNAPFTIQSGDSEIGPVDLPTGTRNLLVTYECAAWPVDTDGQFTVTLKISEQGNNFVDAWSDTFQHQRLARVGVVVPNASFGVGLEKPFGQTARLRVAFQSTVPGGVATTVTVQAV
jgi:hypothetical protein